MYVFKERDNDAKTFVIAKLYWIYRNYRRISGHWIVNIPGARPDIRGKKRIKNIVFKEKLLRRLMTSKSLRLKNGQQHEPNYDNEKLGDDIYVVQELTRANTSF